jgi:hypothetical protein
MKRAPSRQKNQKGLHMNTHTKKRVSPPVMITISERNLICFQPQEGIHLNLVKEGVRIGSGIFEHTVVPFLPDYPNTS